MAFSTHNNTTTIIRDVGSTTTVQNDPAWHLKYYLSIVSTLLGIEDDNLFSRKTGKKTNLKELRDYSNLEPIKREDLFDLVSSCFTFSPDALIGTLFIQDDDLCGDGLNQMLSVSQIERGLLVSDSVIIGGQTRTVEMVMAFKPMWLVLFWIVPIKYFLKPVAFEDKLAKIRQQVPSVVFLESLVRVKDTVDTGVRPPRSSCCAMM